MGAATYTYTNDPADVKTDAARFWVDDTGNAAYGTVVGSNSWYFSDQEVAYAIGLYPNPILAAAWLANRLAMQFAARADKSVGDLRISFGQIAKNYAALVSSLKSQADSTVFGLYVGGVSKSDMESVAANSDRVKQPFRRDQFNIPNSSDAAQIPGSEDGCD